MMYFDQAVQYLRDNLGDFESIDDFGEIIPPEYSDERLAALLAIAIRRVQMELRIPLRWRIEVSPEPPYVDPDISINDDFLELIILKALCILLQRNIEQQFGSESVTAVLGPAKLQTGKAQWGGMPKHLWDASPCAKYDFLFRTWITFDPRKLQAVYAVLPRQNSLMMMPGPNRMNPGATNPVQNDMIQ